MLHLLSKLSFQIATKSSSFEKPTRKYDDKCKLERLDRNDNVIKYVPLYFKATQSLMLQKRVMCNFILHLKLKCLAIICLMKYYIRNIHIIYNQYKD